MQSMNKFFTTTLATLCVTSALFAPNALAGGIENKSNMSTSYLRNPSRNTEHQHPDASLYNVAGTAFMKDGLHLEFGSQFVSKEFSHKVKGTELKYTDNTFVPFYPNAEIVYKHANWAAFLNFSILGGGGNLNYTDGTAPTVTALALAGSPQHEVSISSIVYGWQLGGAYAFNDHISLGAAFRVSYGTQNLSLTSDSQVFQGANGGDEVGYEASAVGFSGVIGVHGKPIPQLDLTAQFAWRSKLDYEFDQTTGNLAKLLLTKDSFRNDISPVLNLGVGYRIIDPVYISASFNYYINQWAEIDSALGENDYNDSYEAAIGVDYDVIKALTLSLGVAYANQGTTEQSNNLFSPVLDSWMFSIGGEVKPIDDLGIQLGLSYVKYFEQDYQKVLTLSKPNFLFFSLSVSYRFGI